MYTQDQILRWLRAKINAQEKIVLISEKQGDFCVTTTMKTMAVEFHYAPDGEIMLHFFNECHVFNTHSIKMVTLTTTRFRPQDLKSVSINHDENHASLMWIDLTTHMFSQPFRHQGKSSTAEDNREPQEFVIEESSDCLSIPIHADKKMAAQFRNAFVGLIELQSTQA